MRYSGQAHGKIEPERQIEDESEFFFSLLRDEFELWMKAQVRIRLIRSHVHITLSASHAIALRISPETTRHSLPHFNAKSNATGSNGPYSREKQRRADFLGRVDGEGWMDAPTPASSGAEWSVGVSAGCWCSVAGSKSTVARPTSGCGRVRGETARRGPSPHPPQTRIHCGIVGSGHNHTIKALCIAY